MARIGYCRTSTDRQELQRQRKSLKAAGCDRIHEETASGKTLDRPVLNEVLASLEPGDVLVIYELDRLGPSMVQMVQVAESLMERSIGLVTLDGKLSTEWLWSHCHQNRPERLAGQTDPCCLIPLEQ